MDNRRFLPIHYACQFGHTDVVKILLNHGSSVLEHNEVGHTSLFFVVSDILGVLVADVL